MLTDNERRILDALSRHGPLSRRDLSALCGMGWATAVKMTSRLEEEGYLEARGSGLRTVSGKVATAYGLSPTRPAALGIDVEYSRVRAAVCSLDGKLLEDSSIPTPRMESAEALSGFLAEIVADMKGRAASLGVVLEGVGIGIPNHLFPDRWMPYASVRDGVAARTDLPVRVDNNIRCFTHAVARFEPVGGSFLVVTIRSGIGVGIVLDGVVYQGEKGRAGELGHLRVDPDGEPCRCGRRGCLETLVNRSIIDAQARSLSLSIAEAFSAARAGDPQALAIVERVTELLGPALASLVLITDIRSILLSASFGADGSALIDPLATCMAQELCPDMDFDLSYRELDDRSYVTGAAFLVLRDFVLR